MIEDVGWNCDDDVSTTSNNGHLRRQHQQLEEEGNHRSLGRRNIKKGAFAVLIILAILFCSRVDENRVQRPSSRGFRRRSMIVHVASFAPPFAPRIAALSLQDGFFRSSLYAASKKIVGALKVASSNTTVSKSAPSTGLSAMSIDRSETKMATSLKTSPIQISSGKKHIPSDKIDQLLDNVDIVALIESYGLQGFKRTSHLKATCLCPFHDDNNPSLQINGERGIYKCFSCGAGGNALNFVREYSEKYRGETRRLKGGIVDATKTNKPLTFVEAIRVLEDCASATPMMGGVPMRQWSGGTGNSTSFRGPNAKKKSRRQQVGLTSRVRILHANLFAAAYFEESLFGLPSAGSARMHLRTRGVRPTTVKAFAMGFAPETYFLSGISGSQQQRSWGEGSLVNRLRDEGFTPQEILDAGLAIVTRKGKEQQLQLQKGHSEGSSEGHDDKESHYEHKDFSTIMDRFRGRLVVPIFDAKGTHVLGFGGRILETSQDANTDFKAAKYLNSPESLVFQKKELLFGNHMVKFGNYAKSSVASKKDVDKVVAQRRPRSLVIVEGYMDAIALWQAGVQETVASMGTALTKEQLLAAAEKARDIGGKNIACFFVLLCSSWTFGSVCFRSYYYVGKYKMTNASLVYKTT